MKDLERDLIVLPQKHLLFALKSSTIRIENGLFEDMNDSELNVPCVRDFRFLR